MSTSQEAPALIQYACERCKTRFVLPPSRRKLSIGGKFRSLSMGLSRTFRYHEGLGSSYDAARRQMLAKMDDEAYQSFVQSFRFCHECRQFVCNECWSTSRRSCLTCVAKSMTGTARPRPPFAPTGPEIPRPIAAAVAPLRKGRARRDAALVGLGLALVLLVVEGGILLANGNGGTAAIATATPSASPTGTPTATQTAIPTISAAPTVAPTPTAVPTPVPTPSLTATPTAVVGATPTARITPKPTSTKAPTAVPTTAPAVTPVPELVATCIPSTGGLDCRWNHWDGGATVTWLVNILEGPQNSYVSYDLSVRGLQPGTYTIQVKALRPGVDVKFSVPVDITVP